MVYLLATGTTACNGSSIDSNAVYPESSLMTMLGQLNNARQNNRSVRIVVGYPNNCQLNNVRFE